MALSLLLFESLSKTCDKATPFVRPFHSKENHEALRPCRLRADDDDDDDGDGW